jgi:hypothetical protein
MKKVCIVQSSAAQEAVRRVIDGAEEPAICVGTCNQTRQVRHEGATLSIMYLEGASTIGNATEALCGSLELPKEKFGLFDDQNAELWPDDVLSEEGELYLKKREDGSFGAYVLGLETVKKLFFLKKKRKKKENLSSLLSL